MIRGIDNQLMINKTVDYSRQMSDQINNIQQGQDFTAEMQRARILHDGNSVQETNETENDRVRRQKEDAEGRREQNENERRHAADDEMMEAEEKVMKKVSHLGTSIDINI